MRRRKGKQGVREKVGEILMRKTDLYREDPERKDSRLLMSWKR